MKTVSVRELHEHTGALVGEAAEGKVIVVEKRGQPVAQLMPLVVTSLGARLRELRPYLLKLPKSKDSGKYLEKYR